MFFEPVLQVRTESFPHAPGKLTVAVKECAAVVVGNTKSIVETAAENLTAQRRALQHVHAAERRRHCIDVAEVHTVTICGQPQTFEIAKDTIQMTTAFSDIR